MPAPVETDVFVVGGGPAGLAAAIAARRNGLSVVVADRAKPPIDKACGEGLLPDGVAALHRLGIDFGPGQGATLRGIRFLDGELRVEAQFPGHGGLGIRRTLLHRILLERAADAGVVMHWRAPITCGGPARVILGGREVRCRWLIGADGAHSRVREWAALPARSGPPRIGLRQHFRGRPWSDFVEVYWRKEAQAYVTPVAPNELCVAVLGSEPRARLADLPALFPGLARRLRGAEPAGPVRGAISVCATLPCVTRGSVALVGDASGGVDAITGEGLSLSLRQAVALGQALAADDLAQYEAAHRRLRRVPHLMASLLLFMAKHDGLRRRVLSALASQPRVFEHLLAVHVTGRPPPRWIAECCGLGLQLLIPRVSRE